jgi:hypothetical protein
MTQPDIKALRPEAVAPVAYLKEWIDEGGWSRKRVDLASGHEGWLATLNPTVTPLFPRESHDALEEENKRLRQALEEIRDLEPVPFDGFPADWNEQINACEECQRYKDHPIQRGICDRHRQPIWARERHESSEVKRTGYRAKSIARQALEPPHD